MPSLTAIEIALPNGLHDAKLRSMCVDYERAEATMVLDVDVSNSDAANDPEYRRGTLVLRGMAFLAVDPPRAGRSTTGHTVALRIAAGAGQPSTSPVELPSVPADCFLYWFFVGEWNGFIRVAARDAEFSFDDGQ